MRISARNQLKGTVESVHFGEVMAEVVRSLRTAGDSSPRQLGERHSPVRLVPLSPCDQHTLARVVLTRVS